MKRVVLAFKIESKIKAFGYYGSSRLKVRLRIVCFVRFYSLFAAALPFRLDSDNKSKLEIDISQKQEGTEIFDTAKQAARASQFLLDCFDD